MDFGLLGYRFSFVSPNAKDRIKEVKKVEDLKAYIIVQGTGWNDIEIYNHAGIEIKEMARYEHMFVDIVKNESDLFPRGVTEILLEYESHKFLKDLYFSRDLVFYYPFPRFFYSSKENHKDFDRIRRGLDIALNDGSMMKLWEQHYSSALELLKNENNTILYFENPNIDEIDKSYEKYLYRLD